MKKTILATAAIAALTMSSQFVVAQTAKPQVMAGIAMEDAGTIYDGTVTKIDAATRTVTLKSKAGEMSVVAGPEVKNFAQIKVGDRFDVMYEIAVAMELVKVKNAGVRSEEVTTNTVTAPKGDKPGMVTTKVVTTVANVVAIDQAKKMVSIKGPEGNIIKLKIKNPALFKDIAVNDQVRAVYVEAIAAIVTAPKK